MTRADTASRGPALARSRKFRAAKAASSLSAAFDIAVFHTRAGQVYAVQAECPHKQGPLADGLLGGTAVMCPFHSRKFDLTTGIGLQGDCNLQTYPVRMDDGGGLWLTV